MDRKSIIAFVLVGLILILWPVYMEKIGGGKKPAAGREAVSAADTTKSLLEQPDKAPAQVAVAAMPKSGALKHAAVPAETLLVETDLYQGKISNVAGGTIVGWRLKNFLTHEKEWIELVPEPSTGNLGVSFDPSLDLSGTPFRLVSDSTREDSGIRKRVLRYSQAFPGYGKLEKRFTFTDGSYDVGLDVKFSLVPGAAVRGNYLLHWFGGTSPTEKDIKEETSYAEALALQGTEMLKTKSDNTGLREGSTLWACVRTKYFLVALIPKAFEARGAELRTEKIQLPGSKNGTAWKRFGAALSAPLKVGVETSHAYTVYLGPLDYHQLKSHGVQLEKVLSFGWSLIRPFSIAFMYTLEFLYKIVRNYGWAIIIFSILIKVALYPLTKKSYDSMKQMQEIQPKLKALQEKYKGDAQRLNTETMKLYKTAGVNPMSGCLPLVLQMPILFALFNLFRTTIMFRQAEFLGLVKDLSRPDNIIPLGPSFYLNILPILMGVTMFIQQKKTVTDPKQKFMSYFMSVFMIYIFYNLSAGLNLYYFMFNILTIAQEMLIKKKPAPDAQAA